MVGEIWLIIKYALETAVCVSRCTFKVFALTIELLSVWRIWILHTRYTSFESFSHNFSHAFEIAGRILVVVREVEAVSCAIRGFSITHANLSFSVFGASLLLDCA